MIYKPTRGDRVTVIADALNSGHVGDIGTIVDIVPDDVLPYRVRLDHYKPIGVLCFSAEELELVHEQT